eukprot:1476107-Rhodomonas_salina.1
MAPSTCHRYHSRSEYRGPSSSTLLQYLSRSEYHTPMSVPGIVQGTRTTTVPLCQYRAFRRMVVPPY